MRVCSQRMLGMVVTSRVPPVTRTMPTVGRSGLKKRRQVVRFAVRQPVSGWKLTRNSRIDCYPQFRNARWKSHSDLEPWKISKIWNGSNFSNFRILVGIRIFALRTRALITVRATSPPVYPSARRGGLRGAGGRATDAKIAANLERGFRPKNRSAAVVSSARVRKKLCIAVRHARFLGRSHPRS